MVKKKKKRMDQNFAKTFLIVDQINEIVRQFGKVRFSVGSLIIDGQKSNGITSFCFRSKLEPWLDSLIDDGLLPSTPIDEHIIIKLLTIDSDSVEICPFDNDDDKDIKS